MRSYHSYSAAPPSRWIRVLRSSGSPEIGMPVPTKTFVTLIQLYSPLWNRLVFWVAGSSMKPSELMTAAKSMRTELLQVTSMTRASLPKAFAHARPTRRQIIGNYWRSRRFTPTPAHFFNPNKLDPTRTPLDDNSSLVDLCCGRGLCPGIV